MEQVGQDVRRRSDESQARERAVSAFLNLGQKLKALANKGGDAAHDESRGGASQDTASPADHLSVSALFNTIEGEIVPRLMLAHRQTAHGAANREAIAATVTPDDQNQFLSHVLSENSVSARQFASEMLRRGVPRDALLLDLISGTARRLGEMWEDDVCNFTDVTLGLCRLHEIVRDNTNDIAFTPHKGGGPGPRILLATSCGDQHVFGIVIVADFFRRAGWRVTCEPGASCRQLCDMVSERSFDFVGLSAACGLDVGDVADEIAAVRAASTNKDLKILVGGRMYAEADGLCDRVGADAYGEDAKAAVASAEKLLAAKQAHC
ncbi:MAG: cobalamin B12-binding domain-containing protein [Pseudomonadota bacterium]